MLRHILALAVVALAGFACAAPLRADPEIIIRIDSAGDEAQPATGKPAGGKPVSLRFLELQVISERPAAEACFTFNLALDRSPDIALENYVTVEPAVQIAATVRDSVLCLEGFEHGRDYTVTLLAGLPGIGGRLDEPETHAIRIEDMRPTLAFADSGVILPRLGNEGLPLRTVNLDKAHVAIARIHDRNLIDEIRGEQINAYWDYRTADIIAEGDGEWVWEGDLLIDGRRNTPVVTALPIDATIGTLAPGVYLATATPADGQELRDESGYLRAPANQWFVVSDLGLTSFLGEDGALIQVRSLADTRPLAGIVVALVSRNNKELVRQTSDADGFVRFDAGLVRGRGGNSAAAIYAYGDAGEFSFIGLEGPALDLSGQDIGGRPVPGPLDAFLYTERGIYRPGETAHLTLLLRDDRARAVESLPLTVRLRRPDGVEVDQQVLQDQGGGSFGMEIPLPLSAVSGQWSVTAHAGADTEAIGSVYFIVEDFVPPRIEFDLSSAVIRVEPQVEVPVDIDARFLYGAPAADLAGELAVVVRPAETPYPGFEAYRFGLEQDWDTTPIQLEPVGFRTGDDGKASVDVALDALPDTTLPLEAVIRAAVFDIGGRPVRREMILPVTSGPFALGLGPRFENDYVESDAVAGFDVVALDPLGKPIDRPGLTWELVKVFSEWNYYTDYNGRGHWQRIDRDSPRIAGGTLDVAAAQPAIVEAQVGWGSYRLEVFDPATGVATSLQFYAGWWGDAAADDGAPDEVAISFDQPSHAPGGVARAFVKPPFAADVAITTVGRETRVVTSLHVGADGAEVEIPIPADATAGFYVVATAFAAGRAAGSEGGPDGASGGTLPRRAIGAGWLTVDPAGQTLAVAIEVPERLVPEQTVSVPVSVGGAAPGEAVFLTLAAVDDGVLQYTGYTAPDPLDYYLGKQRLGVDIRDLYGELIDPSGAARGEVRSGGDGAADARQLANLPKRNTRIVSLFSGSLRLDADGRVEVPLDLPAFNGRLRLMAVAWSAARLGSAEATVIVRAPVVAELSMPLYLAPGDRSDLVLSLHNLDGPAGDYLVTLEAEGSVAIDGDPVGAAPIALAAGAQWRAAVKLRAADPGEGRMRLAVTGPDGAELVREWQIAVRPENPIDVRRLVAALAPGESLALGWDVAEGLFRDTATVNLTVAAVPDFDVPGLVGALDTAHFRWTESIASSAVPLLYFSPEMIQSGLIEPEARAERLQSAVDDVLGWQVARGTFAPAWLYRDERTEEWLTAYVLDFLTRAREQGARVSDLGYDRGIRWLTRFISQDPGDDHGLAVQAYGYYVLARSGNMDAGRARRFFEARGDALPTELARAQIGAALARLGDRPHAIAAFDGIDEERLLAFVSSERPGSPYDYASPLRERAAVLTMMAESAVVDEERLTRMAAALAKDIAATRRLSAQEMAWSLYLAHALAAFDQPVTLSVDGNAMAPDDAKTTPYVRRFAGANADGNQLALLRNDGDRPAYVAVSALGNPIGALPAEANGLAISRRIVDRFGNPVDLDAVRQNDLLVVLIEGKHLNPDGGQITVVDMLPAGFEIESAGLIGGEAESGEEEGVSPAGGDYPWLPLQSELQRAEAREDRFVGLTDVSDYYWRDQGGFRMAYLVRAVTPGDYVLPGVYVEDMYRPSVFARGESGRLRIVTE